MTKEELKRQLHSYRDLKAECAQVSELLAEVEARMTAPRGSSSSGQPRGSGNGDPMLGIVAQHIYLREQYQSMQGELTAAQIRIEEMISGLEPRERRLMRHYYIEGMTWEQVCVKTGYAWRQVHRIHSVALDRLLSLHEKMA